MTIPELLSTYRTIIRERSQAVSLNNRELYLIMNSIANKIKSDVIKKSNTLGFKNYKTFCIALEKVKFGDCSCVPEWAKCNVLKSVEPLPATLTTNLNIALKIYNINRKEIPRVNFLQGKRLSGHPNAGEYYDIINNYVYIFGNLDYHCILVEGLFEDITKLETVLNIDSEPCFNITLDEFPLDDEYIPLLFDLTDRKLNIYLKLQPDESQNFKDDI